MIRKFEKIINGVFRYYLLKNEQIYWKTFKKFPVTLLLINKSLHLCVCKTIYVHQFIFKYLKYFFVVQIFFKNYKVYVLHESQFFNFFLVII